MAQNQHHGAGFCQKNKYGVILGSPPPAACFSPTFRKTRLFSFLCVRFLSYVISPVISIALPPQPSQRKCTTANWNWVKKKSWLIKFCYKGFSVCFLCSKCMLQKTADSPEGLILSLSVLSVDELGGWPGECRTNNTLVYAAWMQMIDSGHKTRSVCETKGVRGLPCSHALRMRSEVSLRGSSLLPEARV